MPTVKVIIDSTVYMPEKYLKELDIDVIPLHVIWGDDIYRDGVDISPEEFYGRLPDAKVMPTTSQPSPKEFMALYEKYVAEGRDILSIHISAQMSGTVDSANQAKAQLNADNIEVVDSRFTTLGTAFQAISAARAAQQGASLQECADIARNVRENTQIYFLVDTLEFLKRGGRIGGAAALLGSALNLKPILYFKEGAIESYEKVRTSKKALARIVEIAEKQIGDKRPVYIGISQATAPENAAWLKAEVQKRFKDSDIIEFVEAELSPVIGTHAGPGTVALNFATPDK
ncbi:MAG: fatty acid kinase fatty acid binding subunit [Chloroflexota bacterium]|nr:fatty acid kinase fatty acid binding subunit [Chloroflexota bacterium]